MKKINIEKIIAVSGMPGLYKIIGNGVKGIIVENITDKKRTIVLNNTKIFSLDTIRIFINDGELGIDEALYRLYETLNHQPAPHHKTASDDEIKSVFEKAIPEYDKERVHINNMRKLFQWYNTLHQVNMLEVAEDSQESADNVAEEKTATSTESEKKNKSKKSASKSEVTDDANAESSAPKKRGRKKKTESENE